MDVSRRSFLKQTGSALALAPLAAQVVEGAGAQPDVLFIAIEDASPHRFGCYGNTVCKTPNIDQFAKTAVRFDDAHTNPPCCPSRTALFLGKRPETTGVFTNRDNWLEKVPDAVTMPAHFRKHGYETIRCGKMFHGKFEDDASWDRIIQANEGLPRPINKRKALYGPGAELKEKKGGTLFKYGPSGREDHEEADGMRAEQAIRLMKSRQASDKPMLLSLGFQAPHLVFTAPDKYFDMYPPEEMVLPKNQGADENGMPLDQDVFKEHNPHTPKQWREAIAAHYATITFIDAQIGRVLQALEASGRAENTIVVIWTDHGFMLGEHFLWRKGPLRDESTQVALLIRASSVSKADTVCKRPVESIDIFPTLMDLCNVPLPGDIEAISMRPILQDPDRAWKKGALMWGTRNKSIVTERWRYNENKRNKRTELFDREKDPGEFDNLSEDPAYADVIKELGERLDGGWKACLPEG
ncbi:MAG: sulfatase [Candidatus Latescibacteria bacterium]|nr:sulfatase [Candidatus Latescibacterota bacterium]